MTDYREKASELFKRQWWAESVPDFEQCFVDAITSALRNAHAAGKAEEQKRCTSATQACLFLIDKLEAFSREIQEEVRVLQQELVKDKTAQDGRALPLSS